MLDILTGQGPKRKLVRVYHEWDVDPGDIIDWGNVTKADKGKFLRFDDGSGWLVKIVNVGLDGNAIKTECGTYRRDDLVHVCRIKWPGANYSGINKEDEHPMVRPYNPREKHMATRTLNGTLNGKQISKRIKMLVLERMQEEADRHGVTEEYVIGRLKHWADTDNRHALEALKTLARIKGVELNQQTDKGNDKPVGIFTQINNYGTIQDQRRAAALPRLKELKEIVASTTDGVECIDLEGDILPGPGAVDRAE